MEEPKVKIVLDKHQWPDEVKEMKQKRKKNLIIIGVVLVTFLLGFFLGSLKPTNNTPVVTTGGSSSSNKFSRLESVYQILSEDWYFGKYIDNLDSKLIDQAIQGMVENDLDAHTQYLTKEEMESFTNSLNMGFVGIGVQYTMIDGQGLIQKVFRDSSAEKAGVQPGDIMYSVDGTSLEGLTSDEIVEIVTGEKGTEVVIEFIRQGEIIEFKIIRDEVNNSAYGSMLNDEVGYLEIYQFGTTTAEEVGSNLAYLQEQGAKSIIIDLRDNGGGYLTSVVDIASYFLPEGSVVLQQEYRDGSLEISKTTNKTKYTYDNIIVLINENTASASEVLAAALIEIDGAVTVGVNSYGKGTVQIPKTFSDGSTLKYTVAEWLSPNGEKINGVGIAAEYDVPLHDVFYMEWKTMEDGVKYQYDQVADEVALVQSALDFLGYSVNRQDGYFDQSTKAAVTKFQSDLGLSSTGEIDNETLSAAISEVVREWNINRSTYDVQLKTAMEILNGK